MPIASLSPSSSGLQPRRAGASLSGFWHLLQQQSPRHTPLAIALALLILPLLGAYALDERLFQGLNVWTKPLKFAVALVVYSLTLAWYQQFADPRTLASPAWRWHERAVVVAVVAEMVWIGGAAVQGTASHFNVATPLAGMIYGLMGLAAVVLTSATTTLAWAIHRHPHTGLPPILKAGLVWGLGLTLPLTLITAGTLSSMNGHWVGGTPSDAGGLPVMGWSRDGGDLRVAHFWATHAMHAIPALAWVLHRVLGWRGVAAARGLAALFTVLVVLTFVQALLGRPFWPGLGT